MPWLQRFLGNHVLANLVFGPVLVLGAISYLQMPRAKDPEINFNWINILTVFPGASALDVERRITDPIEDSLRRTLKDIRFVSSTSREGVSNILVRFNQIDERTFDKRVIDLRREVQNTYSDQLPDEAEDPVIIEIDTSSGFPTAMVVVTGAGDDENLRRQTYNVKIDMERIKGIDRVTALGLADPELHITFLPERLEGLGVTSADITDTVRAYFRDVSAGDVKTRDGQWVVRIDGTNADPESISEYPVVTANGVVPLGGLGELSRTTEEPSARVRFNGHPASVLTVTKQGSTNVLSLIDDIRAYIDKRNGFSSRTGVKIFLVDDQTVSTREALSLMQRNALVGLTLVLLVTWAFLGTHIAVLTSIGIPFTLAGTFLILSANGYTLNNTVLLGVVIALGMLVDDAVVVVESIYQRLQEGMSSMSATLSALGEVFSPVTTSVLTTIAAFLPLMLLPGIMGEFLKVIPLVVTLALIVSLFEAYWMLPAHVIAANIDFSKRSATQVKREWITHLIRLRYTRLLLKALRYPVRSMVMVLVVFSLAMAIVASGQIRFNFFESDAIRLFYVNIEMPRGNTLEDTSAMLQEVEKKVLQQIKPEELRATVTYSGQLFTETEPLFGDTVGQVLVSLNPATSTSAHVYDVADAVE